MKLIYPACFYPLEEQPGFCVEFPDLPGCVTQGKTLDDAISMATDAASGWLLDELEDGNNLPDPTPINKITLDDPNGFVSLIVMDMESYAARYGNKAVRKNLTIPAWLATAADKRHLNYSSILQDALVSILNLSPNEKEA